jgi:hypothetical protein
MSQPKARSTCALNDISEVILHETFKTNPKTPQLFDFQKLSERLFGISLKTIQRKMVQKMWNDGEPSWGFHG